MSWKISKRQALLKKRLINSSRVYWETSHTLNQMLLKMLHNNGVYTPDDFYNRYIDNHICDLKQMKPINKKSPLRIENNEPHFSGKIDQALVNLNSAVIQLKNVIDKRNASK